MTILGGELIKSVHVHLQNVIRLDLWANKFQPANIEKGELKTSGVVLPFHKLGRPLEASFKDSASRGDRFSKARKALGLRLGMGMGIYVLSHSYCHGSHGSHGKVAVAGLSSVVNGGH